MQRICDTSIQEGAPFYRCSENQPRPLPQAISRRTFEGEECSEQAGAYHQLRRGRPRRYGLQAKKRKVIHFISTAGAANTFDGDDLYMQ
jgi:hypothetical protein